MDKKTAVDLFMQQAHHKGCFNGTWLYAENGDIISKGALGWRDNDDSLPMNEDSIFTLGLNDSLILTNFLFCFVTATIQILEHLIH